MEILMSYVQGNGWLGVAIGIVIFIMGYMKGNAIRQSFMDEVMDATIKQMIADGYVKARMEVNPETGKMEQMLYKHDEEYK
jgi:hypothetical protein